ncbi:hypothetical protein [Saccharopolyspora griseoalba]|uniref:Uncharacterized protein n=1 Tax=Saccharopolyspora griseoalba TaxID=1431848 RepID=A0ABW2LKE5_9PSEU
MSRDQIVAVIALSTFGLFLVGLTVFAVVRAWRSPNRRPMRQAWAEATQPKRWEWSGKLLWFPAMLVGGFPWSPDLVRLAGYSAATLIAIVTGSGYVLARRRERRAAPGDRDA